MTALKDIIDNVENIKKIAEKLGFLNLRLLNIGDNTLNFLVSIDKQKSNSDRAILLSLIHI